MFHHRIEDRQQLAHAGRESNLGSFASFFEALVERDQNKSISEQNTIR